MGRKLLRWAPRVLAMLYAGFLSLFSLDVFGEGYGVLKTVLALLIHLIPVFLVLGVLAAAWRRPRMGGVAFLAMAGLYAYGFRGGNPFPAMLVLTGPLILCGVLFLLAKPDVPPGTRPGFGV